MRRISWVSGALLLVAALLGGIEIILISVKQRDVRLRLQHQADPSHGVRVQARIGFDKNNIVAIDPNQG